MYKCLVYIYAMAASVISPPASIPGDAPYESTWEFSKERLVAAGERGGPLTPVEGKWSNDDNRSFGLAISDWNTHRYDEAVEKLKNHLKDHPQSPWAAEAELHIGCYNYYRGHYDPAEEVFKRLLRKYPNGQIVRKALIRLGVMYADSGRYDEAFDCFRKCEDAQPNWQQKTFCRSWLRRIHSLKMLRGRTANCGTLALKKILELRGLFIPDEYLREELSSFSQIAGMAKKQNIQVQGVKLNYDGLMSLQSPAIVHIEPPHFLVVEKADSRNVFTFDPHGGKRILSRERFLHIWDGYTLLFDQPNSAISGILTEEQMKNTEGGCCGVSHPADELGNGGDDIDVGGCSIAGADSSVTGGFGASAAGGLGFPVTSGLGSSTSDGFGFPMTGGLGFPTTDEFGSPKVSINPKNLNIIIGDTPIGYRPARGPAVFFTITYNSQDPQNATGGVGGHNYYPFGNKWSFNFSSFYLLDPGGNVAIVMPDGSRDLYRRNAPPNEHTFIPPVQVYHTLIENPEGSFTLTLKRSKVKYNYSPAHQLLSSIEDRWGNTLILNRDGDGNLVSVVDAAGRETTLTSDENDRITLIEDPIGRTAHFTYNESGDLISVTDMGGYTYSYTYDPNKYLLSLTRPTGTWTFTHAFPDHIVEWPPVTHTWETYKITVTDPKNYTETFYWRGEGYGPTSFTDRNGNMTSYHIREEAQGNVVEYIAKGSVGTYATEGKRLLQYEYDAELNRVAIKEAIDNNCYPRDGSCSYRVTTYTYSNGNITSQTDPSGHQTLYGYDGDDNLTSLTDPLSRTTIFTYDGQDNLTSVIPPPPFDGNTADFTYTPHGKIETITNARGHATVCSYDSLDRLTDIDFPDGTSMSFGYDEIDRITSVTSPTGFTLSYDYDGLNRPIRIDYPDGTYKAYLYNCCGVNTARDRAGKITHYDYDELSRLTLVTDPAGNQTEYTHDPVGNITRVRATRDGSLQTVVEYDYATPADDPNNQENHLNHLAAIIFPGDKRQQFSYYWTGEPKTMTLESGEIVECLYDTGGRLTQAFTGLWGIGYGYNNNDRITTVTYDFPEDVWMSRYSYDELGRISSVDGPDTSDTVSYTYDPAGNRATMAVNGITTSYTYNPVNRLSSVTSPYASASYTYQDGRLDAISYGNGDTTAYGYDSYNRLSSLTSKNSAQHILASYTYGYNLPELITGIADEGGFVESYQYDNLFRLTRRMRDYPSGVIQGMERFGYDEIGNRKRYSENGRVTTSTSTRDNQIIQMSVGTLVDVVGKAKSGEWNVTVNGTPATVEADGTYIAEGLNLPPGPNTLTASGENLSTHETGTHSVNMTKLAAQNVSYTYDARGNMTSRTDATGTSRYDWDPMNRLRSVTFPDGTRHQYFYDGLGRRLKSIENGVERRFVYDGWNVIGEKRAGSDDFVSYYTRGADLGGGIGGIISVHRNGTPQIYPNGYHTGDYFYHYNHRGDVVSVTNSSGNEVAEYWYGAFGNMVRKTGTFDSPYQFSTKEYDAASGLSYFGFRYYSPAQGIWLSKDPLGYVNGLDLYSITINDPINWIDPLGLKQGSFRNCMDRCLTENYGSALGYIDNLGYWGIGAALSGLTIDAFVSGVDKIASQAAKNAKICGAWEKGIIAKQVAAIAGGQTAARIATGRAILGGLSKSMGIVSIGATGFSFGARVYCAIECVNSSSDP